MFCGIGIGTRGIKECEIDISAERNGITNLDNTIDIT